MDLERLSGALTHAFGGSSPTGLRHASGIIHDFLREGGADHYGTLAPTTRAQHHANGFLKLVVVDRDEWGDRRLAQHRLVLHVWSEETATGRDEEIHSHRWPFWSVLLCGTLEWHHFHKTRPAQHPETGSAASPYLEYAYDSPGSGGAYTLRRRQKVSLAPGFSALVGPGTRAHMTTTEIHRVRHTGDGVAATLVLQGPPVPDAARVYLPASDVTGASALMARPVRRPDRPVLRSTLARLLAVPWATPT